jgi:biopolymer transport protein ExbD
MVGKKSPLRVLILARKVGPILSERYGLVYNNVVPLGYRSHLWQRCVRWNNESDSGVSLDKQMVSRPHLGRSIFTCDLNAFSLIMAVLIFAVLAVFLAFGGTYHHGIGPLLPKVHRTKVLGYLNWGANRDDAMIAAVTRDSRIYFGAEQVTSAALPAKIRERLSRGSERRVYIKADALARYGTVKEVLKAMQSAGVEKVSFLCR